MQKKIVLGSMICLGLAVVGVLVARSQDKSNRPSPPAKAECALAGDKTITVAYSSPRAKGRKIFGGLVPFIATALVAESGNIYAGLMYPISVALITFCIGCYFIHEQKTRIKMNEEIH